MSYSIVKLFGDRHIKTLYVGRHFHYIKKSVAAFIQFPELRRNKLHKSQILKSAHVLYVLAFGVNQSHVCIAKRGKKLENYDFMKTACKLYIIRKLLFRQLIFKKCKLNRSKIKKIIVIFLSKNSEIST